MDADVQLRIDATSSVPPFEQLRTRGGPAGRPRATCPPDPAAHRATAGHRPRARGQHGRAGLQGARGGRRGRDPGPPRHLRPLEPRWPPRPARWRPPAQRWRPPPAGSGLTLAEAQRLVERRLGAEATTTTRARHPDRMAGPRACPTGSEVTRAWCRPRTPGGTPRRRPRQPRRPGPRSPPRQESPRASSTGAFLDRGRRRSGRLHRGGLGRRGGLRLRGVLLGHQLDHRHRGVVALARTDLGDPGVAARTLGVARRDLLEQRVHDALVPDRGEDLATVVQVALLRLGDQLLRDRTQHAGPWPRWW